MNDLISAASASLKETDLVAKARAAAEANPAANAGAGQGIKEGEAEILDGMAVFDGPAARGGATTLPGDGRQHSAVGGVAGGVSSSAGGSAAGGKADVTQQSAVGQLDAAARAAEASKQKSVKVNPAPTGDRISDTLPCEQAHVEGVFLLPDQQTSFCNVDGAVSMLVVGRQRRQQQRRSGRRLQQGGVC